MKPRYNIGQKLGAGKFGQVKQVKEKGGKKNPSLEKGVRTGVEICWKCFILIKTVSQIVRARRKCQDSKKNKHNMSCIVRSVFACGGSFFVDRLID